MNVLLIGGRGYLGKHIYRHLSLDNAVYCPTSRECDVTNEQSINDFVNNLPNIDMLVYAAVKKTNAHCLDSVEEFTNILDVNLMGAIRCCRAVVPKMKTGKIILIGSVDGTFGNPNNGMYSVTKGALHQYARCLGVMLKEQIAVNCVVPGTLRTDEDAVAVAKLVAFLSTADHISCSMLRVDNGHHTFAI
jgi:NAD(P)-dependent dehydrogenase (short-subunit alcohol dehydrogenase family)